MLVHVRTRQGVYTHNPPFMCVLVEATVGGKCTPRLPGGEGGVGGIRRGGEGGVCGVLFCLFRHLTFPSPCPPYPSLSLDKEASWKLV